MNTSDDLIRMRRELSELMIANSKQQRRINSLEQGTTSTATTAVRDVGDNVLRNCEVEFSDDAYNNLGLGGDAAQRAAHWYRHNASDTLLAFTAAEMLRSSGHSGYAADDPDWEISTGRIRLGSTKTISQPLLNKYVQPRAILYLQFTATLRTSTPLPVGLQFIAEFHDNTAGQEKVIEGDSLEITATVEGTPGAVTVDYRVIVLTDTGDEYQIDLAAAVTTAPAVSSIEDFVRLSWPSIPGRVSATIYRLKTGIYSLIGVIVSGSSEWNDYGDAGSVLGGAWPSAANTTLKARVVDTAFAPEHGVVKGYGYAIEIPSDYDITLTTGQQALRMRLSAALTDAQQLILDRFQLGQNFGGFQRSAADLAVTNSISITGSPTGALSPAPTSDPGDPPPRGGGGERFYGLQPGY